MRRSTPISILAVSAGLAMAPMTTHAAQAKTEPATVAPAAKPLDAAVDPASVKALEIMSAHLRTVQAFQMKADILIDDVGDDGRKLQYAMTATYKVRRPTGFRLEIASDRKLRELYYDGKKITVFAPNVGFYAQADAPPTIRKTLEVLRDKYDVEVPLEDLFKWGEPGDNREALQEGFYVGPAHLNGVETDQYAYSTGDIDWQLWIQRGAAPLPVKIVITSISDPAQPQFSAVMAWNTTPTFQAADFTFTPPATAKPITFASTSTVGK